jgi:hypothetical protein
VEEEEEEEEKEVDDENRSNVKFLEAAFVKKRFRIIGLKYMFLVAVLLTDFPVPKLSFARIKERKKERLVYLFKATDHICNECLLPVRLARKRVRVLCSLLEHKTSRTKKYPDQIVKPHFVLISLYGYEGLWSGV